MPLPFILAGAAIVAGGYGVKKGVDAKNDFDEAKSINKEAQDIYDKSEKELERARKNAQYSIENLGKTKFNLYEHSLLPFVNTFSQIKNINFDDNSLLNANHLPKLNHEELGEMQKAALEMQEIVTGGVTALGTGGLAGLAAYGGVGMLGTASTGTAIAGLSGAAATNATLAWLGGGSLATGGLGMAGGTAILGGIVAGPVLAVGGMMLASKAEAAKEDAYSNLEKAKLAAEEMKTASVTTEGIQCRFDEINAILNALNERFEPLLNSLITLVAHNNNYTSYSNKDKKGVFISASLAKTLKNIIEAPLLTQEGNVTSESEKMLIEGQQVFTKLVTESTTN